MEFENKVAVWRIFSFCAFGLAFFFLGRDIAAAVRTEYFYDVAHPKTQKVLSKYVPAAYVKSKLLDEPVLLMSPPTKGKLCGKKKGKLLEEYQSSHHAAGTLGISVGDVEAACNKREKHGCPVKGDQNRCKVACRLRKLFVKRPRPNFWSNFSEVLRLSAKTKV